MAAIGDPQRVIEVVPLHEPVPQTPEPAYEPQREPAEPVKEPVHD